MIFNNLNSYSDDSDSKFNLIQTLNYWNSPPSNLISLQSPSRDTCHFQHDRNNLYLSTFILVGMVVSYLPQHYRIIKSKSSKGINPWFLLLGSTSSTSSLVNVITLQWGVVRCCRFLTPGQCTESLLGIFQVFLQWTCFNILLILSLIYFPKGERYVRVVPVDPTDRHKSTLELATSYSSQFLTKFFPKHKHQSKRRKITKNPNQPESSIKQHTGISSSPSHESLSPTSTSESSQDLQSSDAASSDSSSFDLSNVLPPSATRMTPSTLSKEYTISLVLAFVVLLHFIFSAFITLCILLLLPKASLGEPSGTPPSHSDQHPTIRLLRIWATFSGLLSMILAGFQYLPQIWTTMTRKLVEALSINMMLIQTPGSFIFVYSLAVRPGCNWTTWIVYLISGILQGFLLILCILWKIRQQANGIDDWGKPLVKDQPAEGDDDIPRGNTERSPLLPVPNQTASSHSD